MGCLELVVCRGDVVTLLIKAFNRSNLFPKVLKNTQNKYYIKNVPSKYLLLLFYTYEIFNMKFSSAIEFSNIEYSNMNILPKVK